MHGELARVGPAIAVASMLLQACAATPAREPLSLAEIVQMSESGKDAGQIVSLMQQTHSAYRVTGAQLARLRSEGVADPVLDYMLQSYLQAERDRPVEGCSSTALLDR